MRALLLAMRQEATQRETEQAAKQHSVFVPGVFPQPLARTRHVVHRAPTQIPFSAKSGAMFECDKRADYAKGSVAHGRNRGLWKEGRPTP